jgi:hypothetical protein
MKNWLTQNIEHSRSHWDSSTPHGQLEQPFISLFYLLLVYSLFQIKGNIDSVLTSESKASDVINQNKS